MASIFTSGKVFVTLEYPDGSIFSGQAAVSEVTVSQPLTESIALSAGDSWVTREIAGPPEWSVELIGLGALQTRATFAREVHKEKTASEWRCVYCGAINLREHRQCQGCAAYRPFIYEGNGQKGKP